MKKILFIMNDLSGGGAEKVFVDILRNMDYKKYDIDFLLVNFNGVYLNDIPDYVKTTIIYYDDTKDRKQSHRNLRKYRNYGIKYFIKRRIPKNILSKRYDIIVSFLEGNSLIYHSLLIKNSLKNIAWVHTDLVLNHWTKDLFYKSDESKMYQQMDHIVHVSQQVKIQFKKLFPNCDNKVIYNFIDKQSISELSNKNPINYQKFTISLVGRLSKIKAYDRAIQVAKYLNDKGYDIDFNIIGEGEERVYLEKQIELLNLESCVHLLGFKKPPYNYMKNSDIFLSVSIVEGYPLVTCEALCLGLPIISTKTSGNVEILEDKYGMIVDDDVQSIARAIQLLYDDKDLLNKYRELSIKKSEQFDKQNILEQLDSLFLSA